MNFRKKQRHKGNSKQSGKGKSKKMNEFAEKEIISDEKRMKLQEDLAKAMLSAAKISMKTCTEKLVENAPSKCEDLINSDDDDNVDSEEVEVDSDEQSESSDDASTDEQKMNKKNSYANGCCNVSPEQSEKVL